MSPRLTVLEMSLLVGIALGSACWLATLISAFFFRRRRCVTPPWGAALPAVTLLKPVYGLEKRLYENLRTACLQDYPEYQVIFCVQRDADPAIPILRALEAEFGGERVTVVVESVRLGSNGKVNNLAGALPHARHDTLVISDSDVCLAPGFLREIVAPLADPAVGAVSTFFRAANADRWFEKLELLSLSSDQFGMALLATACGWQNFCFGVSTAFRKQTLTAIGGFEGLADHLVEDNEMAQRLLRIGRRMVVIPHVVPTTVDLPSLEAWAQKQTYWEQNTLAAVPGVFFASLLLRVIPLSLGFALLRGWDSLGVAVLGAAFSIRLAAAAVVLGVALRDTEALRALWLLPLKDTLSPIWAVRALLARTVVWRGVEMSVSNGGRLAEPTRSHVERRT